MRHDFEFYDFEDDLVMVPPMSMSPLLKDSLATLNMPFFVDNELLFWQQHFASNGDFATYDNGHKKGGTLRYKTGHIRIPAYAHLPVFETEEHKAGKSPRGLVYIPKMVVCSAGELSQDELDKDGFRDHDHMLKEMRSYYPDVSLSSLVSFYHFERYDKYAFNNPDVWTARQRNFPRLT